MEASASSAASARDARRVAVVLPVHNGQQWLDGCMRALLAQTVLRSRDVALEVSAFDDASTDGTWCALGRWAHELELAGMRVTLGRSTRDAPGGCGYAKNRAVAQCDAEWLCFQDVDDVSAPSRVEAELAAAEERPRALVGCQVVREPAGATERYIRWANGMGQSQLVHHRFRECTLLMPTWFMARADFVHAGGFREEQCEDLLLLLAHVAGGGTLHRVDQPLVTYRYHASAATHSIPRRLVQRHRAAALEADVLRHWPSFSIWGCGRDGRELFKALSPAARARVACFVDVDAKKIGVDYVYGEHRVAVEHWSRVRPPFVTCVALERTGGAFEANLASLCNTLDLAEGTDYFHFN